MSVRTSVQPRGLMRHGVWVVAAIALFWPARAHAATLTVTNLNDSGAGSLRAAIAGSAPGDLIVFAPGVTGVIALTSTPLDIGHTLTISGPGPASISIDGKSAHEVFRITNGSVEISGVRIQNGRGGSGSDGGGITSADSLTLRRCLLVGSHATYGGAVGGGVKLDIIECTISGNLADQQGGGIAAAQTTSIVRSMIQGNTANAGGGGIMNGDVNHLTIESSTIYDNNAPYGAGVLTHTDAFTLVRNSTIVSNYATADGGGIRNTSSYSCFVRNSIIAGNHGTPNIDVSGIFTSNGYNLVGVGNGSGFGLSPGDQVGTAGSPIDPLLGSPSQNGGTTLTMPPLNGSPALDRGNSDGTHTDQRDRPRPYDDPALPNPSGGDGSDIGAFERNPLASTVPSTTAMPRVTLAPPSPNPMVTDGLVEYTLDTAGLVDVGMYDVRGRLVRRLEAGWRRAGAHRVVLNVAGAKRDELSSGVYFVMLRTAGVRRVQTLVVLR